MPDYDLRQRRLLELIHARYKDNRGRFIDDSHVDPTYLSRLLATNRHRRKLGEELARKIEQNCGLTEGWFDIDDSATREPSGHYELLRNADWPFSFSKARLDRLESQEREEINDLVLHFLERFEARRKKAGKARRKRDKPRRLPAPKAISK